MDLGLQGKVALVTGATSNIGRATALGLAGEGACVVANGRDEAHGFFTAALHHLDPAQVQRIMRSGPLPRTAATADEVAAAVLYLASEQAAFVTGQIIHVDGGTLL